MAVASNSATLGLVALRAFAGFAGFAFAAVPRFVGARLALAFLRGATFDGVLRFSDFGLLFFWATRSCKPNKKPPQLPVAGALTMTAWLSHVGSTGMCTLPRANHGTREGNWI